MMKRLGVNDPNVILALTNSSSDPIKFLDQLKQICFYVEAVKEQKKCVWWLPSEITDEQLAKVYLGTAYEVVMDDRIKWTPEALEVFKRHAKYENEIAVYADMLGYYTELFNSGHITEDRFLKLKTNIQNSSPVKDMPSDK
nr:hypothetical protein [Pedobacter sp. ASV28]